MPRQLRNTVEVRARSSAEIVAKISGDPTQAERTWALLTEAAEGGWGIAGTAFGRDEFIALLRPKQ